MFSIQIENKEYSTSEIVNNNSEAHPALIFCQKWLRGDETFTLQTSGSTGTPKQIEVSRNQMQVSAMLTIEALKLDSTDIAFVCLNTEYIAGIMMLVRSMIAEMKAIVVNPSANPLTQVQNPAEITFAAMVPLQVMELFSQYQTIPFSPKALIIGGAPTSQNLEEKIKNLNFPVYATYGMTETVSHIALRRLDEGHAQDSFNILNGISIQLDNRNCLQIKGKVTADKWLSTNDICIINSNKTFKVEGRIDNTINSGGVKVQAEKVEKLIEQIFNTLSLENRFFIIGTPDEKLGQIVTWVIEGSINSYAAIINKLEDNLSKFELPKKICVYENFNETLTFKIDKNATLKNKPTKEIFV